MKKIYLALALLASITTNSFSQITITQSDMPGPGDTTRLTSAEINLLLNYAATGPNYTWNFANLRTNTQLLDSPMSVSATNFIYALYFANFGFNPNRASVAYADAGLAVNPLIPLTNPYSFNYLTSSVYKQVGIGAELVSIPTPIAFNNHDVIYNLPLNYGDADTSDSDWGLGIPGVGYLGYAQTRINEVDGWGTLTTPHGTYDVLRVKTIRAQRDTIGLDSLSLNFAIDRPLLTEYKWLANGETKPVMQVNTQTIFGIEIITEILFIDDFLRIETNPLASSTVCAGSTISVPYTKYGSFNGPSMFNQGNRFRAQLSDTSGSFANPLVIGSVTSITSGVISATIPGTILPGNHYRIRVVSTDPVVEGSDNGTDITIEYPVLTNINAAGPLAFCAPGQVTLLADSGFGYSYQWLLNGTAINGATLPNYDATQSGSYTVDVSNSCGTVTTAALVVDVLPLPSVTQLNSNQIICNGGSAMLYATVTDATSLQWQLNGSDITGETADSISVSQAGNYTLVATNSCGNAVSTVVSVTTGVLPAAVVTSAQTTLCAGDSALLLAAGTDILSYQWQLNGIDIGGAVDSFYFAAASGSYTVAVTNLCGTVQSSAINITINPPLTAPVITQSADTLYTTAANSYQWYLNGNIIPGATSFYYVTTQNGLYTVLISDTVGCTATSGGYNVVNTGIDSHVASSILTAYPSPVSDLLFVNAPAGIGNATLMIRNMMGQQVMKAEFYQEQQLRINVSSLAAGCYTITLQNRVHVSNCSFIKQ